MIRKHSSLLFALLALPLLLTACAFVQGDEAKADPEAGFVSLFNGENLEGWIGATNAYKAVDGTIHLPPGSGGNLYTEKEYSNFVLRFEFKLTPGANNGLGIRAPKQGDAAYVGIELQILDNEHPKYANLQPWQYHGSAYGLAAAKRGFLKETGEWNVQEVTVNGRDIKVVLNGETILDVNLDEATKNGTLSGHEHPGAKRTTGHLGFLGHGDEVWFRNIRIKEIN